MIAPAIVVAAVLCLAGTTADMALSQSADVADSPKSELIPVPPAIQANQTSFTLEDLAGGEHDLSKTRAKLVLVHFFATWCEPCREELPALDRLVERSASANLAVLALSVGEPDDRVRRFLATMPLSFPVLLDRHREVAKKWGVDTLPSTFILNRELERRLMVEGEFEWDRIRPEELSAAIERCNNPLAAGHSR